jgi:hypothetical protein
LKSNVRWNWKQNSDRKRIKKSKEWGSNLI